MALIVQMSKQLQERVVDSKLPFVAYFLSMLYSETKERMHHLQLQVFKMILTYQVNVPPSVEEFISLLRRSTLAKRRPVEDEARIATLLAHSNFFVTAREEGTLIGIARALTDYAYCCYVSDLAVDQAYQKKGIGRQLINHIRTQLGERCAILLLAAPAALSYYPHLGMDKIDNGFIYPRTY